MLWEAELFLLVINLLLSPHQLLPFRTLHLSQLYFEILCLQLLSAHTHIFLLAT